MNYINDEVFKDKKSDFFLEVKTYEYCSFLDCDFQNSNLYKVKFINCDFENCNLSNLKLEETSFQKVSFKNCKMIGLLIAHCSDFAFDVGFESCLLNFTSFYNKNLKKTYFKNCDLQEVDFSNCNLTSAIFENTNLRGSIFDQSILEKANFKTAFNYSINPNKNKLKQAEFSLKGLAGLLEEYALKIHDI